MEQCRIGAILWEDIYELNIHIDTQIFRLSTLLE